MHFKSATRFTVDERAYLLFATLVVLLVASAIRLSGASGHSMWSDEGWNLWVIQGSTVSTVFERLANNHHPPAYFLSLDLWEVLAGDSRIALRYITILAGVLNVAIIFRIGADLFGYRTAFAASLVFGLIEQAVYYGQSVRHYEWLTLGISFTLLFISRYISRPRISTLFLYIISVVFTLYTMYLGAIVIVMQALLGLFSWRGSTQARLRLFAGYVWAGLLLLPWIIYALPGTLRKVEVGVIGGYHNSFASTGSDIPKMIEILFGGQFVLGLSLFLIGAYHILRERDLRQIIILVCGGGIFIVMLILNYFVGILSERTLYYLVPAVILVFAYGFRYMSPHLYRVILSILALWFFITPPTIVPTINSGPTARAILQDYNNGDFILLETGFDDVAFEYEMLKTLPIDKDDVFRSYYEYDYPDDMTMMQELAGRLAYEERVWLVYWNVPPRMGDYLTDRGFVQVQYTEIPTGSNDPLYSEYPVIAISLFVRPDDNLSSLDFENKLTLVDAIISRDAQVGQTLYVDLWWRVNQSLERDYSVGVFLLDINGVTQIDHIGPGNPMTQWPIDELIFDRHPLVLPDHLIPGEYTIIANVYWWENVEPLTVNGEPYATLGTILIR